MGVFSEMAIHDPTNQAQSGEDTPFVLEANNAEQDTGFQDEERQQAEAIAFTGAAADQGLGTTYFAGAAS